MSKTTLAVENLSFQIGGKQILDSVSFEVDKGEILLLCGGSGSGKSTLANLINGYFPENGGKQDVAHIKIRDEEVQTLSVVQRSNHVRTIFQNARLSFSMKTLREEMVFCLENSRVNAEKMDKVIKEKARYFNLEYLLDRSFDDLSGGELQRAAFVCADLVDVPLYIMDEPFANVDEATMQDYIRYMNDLADKGKVIIVIDHHISRWRWVDRWLLIDSCHQLRDLSLIQSEAEREKLLTDEGLIVDTSTVLKNSTESEHVLLELDKVSVYHEKTLRKSLFRKEKQRNTLIEEAAFDLTEGTLAALVGPSGIGKTSLFQGQY
ncbi:MAG: ABC transporter ATP-binding protein [Alkalibacterium sp.]|nr:ABC transporter ATP-binding protein [Alkalibacterium sp.]